MKETSSNSLASLWQHLRDHGLQRLAVVLIQHEVRSVDDIHRLSTHLLSNGISDSEMAQLLASTRQERDTAIRERADLPMIQPFGRRASFTLALNAAQPNNRKRALDELDRDILARSSQPSQESRVRTYRALCAAWQVDPFPMTIESIRCAGASMKAGFYRSSNLYFQSAVNYQLRFLREPVHPLLRATIRDVNRSIKRGLGPSKLKEGFDVFSMAALIDPEDSSPFDALNVHHFADVVIIGSWFMMREIEIAGAVSPHLSLHGLEVQLALPVHKTSTDGNMTLRSLRCPCKVILHKLCPWHAAERHLIRLCARRDGRTQHRQPLVPAEDGRVLSKFRFIELLRNTLRAAGISLTVATEDGPELHRFGGHALRVSGAMMLAGAGVPVQMVQMLGRWSSSAVERYVQASPMVAVPSIPGEVLRGDQRVMQPSSTRSAVLSVETPLAGSSSSGVGPPPTIIDSESLNTINNQMDQMKRALKALRGLVCKPQENFIVRPRSKVFHVARIDEQSNIPAVWQTQCGWSYGTRRFFRVPAASDGYVKCKKCFPGEDSSPVPAIGNSSSEQSDSSSDSSSSEEAR